MEQNESGYPLLIAQNGPLSGKRWTIQGSMILGRENDCDITVPNRQVSRNHARLSIIDNGVLLEDLGSKNGTHRNGKPIEEPVLLQDGDTIQIALAQQFVFVSSDETMPLDISQAISTQPQEFYLRLDKRSRRVWIMEEEIIPPLSAAQFGLLEALYDRQGRVLERYEVIETVWGEKDAIDVSEQALDALVRRLRDRIAQIDPNHVYIITVRGHGLRLDNPRLET